MAENIELSFWKANKIINRNNNDAQLLEVSFSHFIHTQLGKVINLSFNMRFCIL